LAFLAGCASHGSLVPGQSTAADVDKAMGRMTEQRPGPSGETVRYYSRLPYGRQIYAARIGGDGRLIAIEPRLTTENMEKMVRGSWTASQVRDLLGPPWEVHDFPRQEREAWTYQMHGTTWPKHLYVQFSKDGILREVIYIDDPEIRSIEDR
jgi:hypothetical protein